MKILVENHTWVAATGAITFTDFASIKLIGGLVVTNVTDNIVIYNFAKVGLGGTVATNVLTVAYDTSGMADADDLQIFYDDGKRAEGDEGVADLTTGVLMQGDDGVDRKNMAVDAATGHVRTQTRGYVAHDAAAGSDNPIKGGAVATDYTPDSEGEQGQAAVADGDVVQLSADLGGLLPERVLAKYDILAAINGDYDAAPTTAVSADIPCERYRWAQLSYYLDITLTPTTIRFDIEVSPDGTTWAKLTNGPLAALIYDDTSIGGGIEEAIAFPIACKEIRVRVTCVGTDATNIFTVANATLYFRN